jgi:hypothetical protein
MSKNYLERRRHLHICSLVEYESIVGRRKEVDSKLRNNVLPILQKQPGLVDSCAFRQEPELHNCDSLARISKDEAVLGKLIRDVDRCSPAFSTCTIIVRGEQKASNSIDVKHGL